jgi:hypothetical protein
VFASVWASSARPRPGSRGEERARWQGYSPPPTSADRLSRRIVLIVDPLSRAAVMLTPRASAPVLGRARAGRALTGSDLPLTFHSPPAGTTASRLPRIVLSQIANSGSAAAELRTGRRAAGFTFGVRDASYHGWFRAMGLTPRNVRRRT